LNRLSLDRRAQAISPLVEGNSIRSTERMTGIHRDTSNVMKSRLTFERSKTLSSPAMALARATSGPSLPLDPDRKLVPTYRGGKRTRGDLSTRLANQVQLSTDALSSYADAVEGAFGADVDYAQVVKFYEAEPVGPGRYSPPKVTHQEKKVFIGIPEWKHISTSKVDRQNLTMRMQMRRFTRLTNGFSKKRENLQAAVALHFAHYNFARIHKSLRV
jgi:hypothetical protein